MCPEYAHSYRTHTRTRTHIRRKRSEPPELCRPATTILLRSLAACLLVADALTQGLHSCRLLPFWRRQGCHLPASAPWVGNHRGGHEVLSAPLHPVRLHRGDGYWVIGVLRHRGRELKSFGPRVLAAHQFPKLSAAPFLLCIPCTLAFGLKAFSECLAVCATGCAPPDRSTAYSDVLPARDPAGVLLLRGATGPPCNLPARACGSV